MLLPRIFGPIFGLSALLSAASLMQSTPASACSCMFPTVEAAREDASAVFEGRVLAIKALPGDAGASDGKTQVTFAVVRTWKGLDREEQRFTVLRVQPQEGVHAAFDGAGLGEVVG